MIDAGFAIAFGAGFLAACLLERINRIRRLAEARRIDDLCRRQLDWDKKQAEYEAECERYKVLYPQVPGGPTPPKPRGSHIIARPTV